MIMTIFYLVKDIEFVSLYNLWRRVVLVVVSLVVLVPLIALDTEGKVLQAGTDRIS